MQNQNILVTGGAGFIGSHLIDALLTRGAKKVVAVDNLFLGKKENLETAFTFKERFVFYSDDVSEYSAIEALIEKEKIDVVYNLATKALLYSFLNPAGAYSINTNIALNLAELLRKETYEQLIHLSTSEVYGSAQFVPMTENHPLLAETTYAAGKASADLALTSYINQYNLNITIARPFNNYGPRQNDRALAAIIPLTVRRIMQGLPPFIEGDGLQTRDFIYVEDTVNALIQLKIVNNIKGQIFNLASGKETTIKEIIEQIVSFFEFKDPIEYRAKRVADVRRHMADVTAIEKIIGPVSQTSLKEGLNKTLTWYKENIVL